MNLYMPGANNRDFTVCTTALFKYDATLLSGKLHEKFPRIIGKRKSSFAKKYSSCSIAIKKNPELTEKHLHLGHSEMNSKKFHR